MRSDKSCHCCVSNCIVLCVNSITPKCIRVLLHTFVNFCFLEVTRLMPCHYIEVIMTMMASQITSLTVVSSADQRKQQSSASLAFVRGIHRGPVNSPHKWPVTWKIFPFDDVIMLWTWIHTCVNVYFLEVPAALFSSFGLHWYMTWFQFEWVRVTTKWRSLICPWRSGQL